MRDNLNRIVLGYSNCISHQGNVNNINIVLLLFVPHFSEFMLVISFDFLEVKTSFYNGYQSFLKSLENKREHYIMFLNQPERV